MPNMTSNVSTRSLTRQSIEPVEIWYWSLKIFIALLSILGNGLVIYLICFRRRLRVTNNWFILSLAVADFCIGIFTTSSGLACTFHFWCDGILQITFYNFMFFASTLNLWAMAIDRYIGTVHSLRYVSLMTNTRVIIMLVLAWGISFMAAFVRLFWIYHKQLARKVDKYYRVFTDLFFGVFSCAVLLAIYLRILHISRKLANQTVAQREQVDFNMEPTKKSRRRLTGRSSGAQVLGAVVLLFVLCYSLNIYFSFCIFSGLCPLSKLGRSISLLLVHFNSAVNFAVYAFMKNDIRMELTRLCRCSNMVEISDSCAMSSALRTN